MPFVISAILVLGYVCWLLSGPNSYKPKEDRLFELFHENGFFIRDPKGRWERFFFLYWRDHEWARRLLGGTWEAYIHDMGTFHAIITWHWVEKPSTIKSTPLFRIEKWVKGRRQVVVSHASL